MEITEPSKTGQPTHVIQIQDLKRLENWILALKLRYWIDFGQRKQYNVEWIRKLDSNGDLVEIVIKVDQHKDADCDTSNCQCQSETSEDLLFAINVDLKSLRISVEGNHRDLWNQTEFLKLRDFVSDLARMEEVNTSAVNDSYDKVFGNIKNDSSSSDQCFDKSNTSINLEGVSLDIYADSDNEHGELQEINGSQSNNKSFSKSNKARSSRKSLKQIRKQSNKTPTKKSSCGKFKIPNDDIFEKLKQVKDFLTQCSNRIDNLENIFSKLDKDMAISDLEIRLINDKLSASKDDMTSSFASQLKHELTVSKQELNQFKDDVNEKLTKSETELNKLRGRVGSLVDEKSNLQKKVKSLEAENQKLSQELLILKNNNASNESRPSKEPSEAQSPKLLQVPKSPQSESKTGGRENQQTNKSEVNSVEEYDVHQACSTGSPKDSNQEIPEYDVVMLCDSNRKFLDIHKLSGTRNSRMIACGTTGKAIEIISTPRS